MSLSSPPTNHRNAGVESPLTAKAEQHNAGLSKLLTAAAASPHVSPATPPPLAAAVVEALAAAASASAMTRRTRQADSPYQAEEPELYEPKVRRVARQPTAHRGGKPPSTPKNPS